MKVKVFDSPDAMTPEWASGLTAISAVSALTSVPSATSIQSAIQNMRDASVRYDLDALNQLLRMAVPEFHPIGVHPDYQGSSTVVAFPARNARKV